MIQSLISTTHSPTPFTATTVKEPLGHLHNSLNTPFTVVADLFLPNFTNTMPENLGVNRIASNG